MQLDIKKLGTKLHRIKRLRVNWHNFFSIGNVRTKQYALDGTLYCEYCRNYVGIILIETTKWVCFFTVPALPYQKEYYKKCPYCGKTGPIPGWQFEAIILSRTQ